VAARLLIILVSVFILFINSNCKSGHQENGQIEGDLYFDWLRIGSFYNEPDSVITQFKLYADTANRKNLDSSSFKILTMYEILKKENLLYRPFIDLRLDNDSVVKIYFANNDYERIKVYKRQNLLDTKKKIRLKMTVRNLGLGMALCTKLISVNKVDGQTYQVNPKLKIEDYR
jgi:hypothetical protein